MNSLASILRFHGIDCGSATESRIYEFARLLGVDIITSKRLLEEVGRGVIVTPNGMVLPDTREYRKKLPYVSGHAVVILKDGTFLRLGRKFTPNSVKRIRRKGSDVYDLSSCRPASPQVIRNEFTERRHASKEYRENCRLKAFNREMSGERTRKKARMQHRYDYDPYACRDKVIF